MALAMMQLGVAVMVTHGDGLNSNVTNPVKTVFSFVCGHLVTTEQVSTAHLAATKLETLGLMQLVLKYLLVRVSAIQ